MGAWGVRSGVNIVQFDHILSFLSLFIRFESLPANSMLRSLITRIDKNEFIYFTSFMRSPMRSPFNSIYVSIVYLLVGICCIHNEEFNFKQRLIGQYLFATSTSSPSPSSPSSSSSFSAHTTPSFNKCLLSAIIKIKIIFVFHSTKIGWWSTLCNHKSFIVSPSIAQIHSRRRQHARIARFC